MPGLDVTRVVEPVPQPQGAIPPTPSPGQASSTAFRDALTQAQPAPPPEDEPAPPAPVAEQSDPPPQTVTLPDDENDAPEGAALAAISAAIVDTLPPPVPVSVQNEAPPPVRTGSPASAPANAPVPPPAWEGLTLGETPRGETRPEAGPLRELPETAAVQPEDDPAATSTPAVPTTPVGTPPVELAAHWSRIDEPAGIEEPTLLDVESLPPEDAVNREAPLRGRVPPPEILASFTSPELPVAQRVSVATNRVPPEALPEVDAEVSPPVPRAVAPDTPRPVRRGLSTDAELPEEAIEPAIDSTGTEGVDPFVLVENSTDSNGTDDPSGERQGDDRPRDLAPIHRREPMETRDASEVVGVAESAPVQPAHAVREPALRESRLIDHVAPQLAYGLRVATAAAGQGVRVQLDPPELGRVQVDVTITHGTVTARVAVESAATQRLLNDNLPQLREALTQQGVVLDRLVVESHGESLRSDVADRSFSHSGQQQQNPDEGRQWFLDEAETPAEPRRARVRTGRLDVQI